MGSSSRSDGRTTPELRISPTPPEPTHNHTIPWSSSPEPVHVHTCPHSRPHCLQRQEPLDESYLPVSYATLHEEENEAEDIVLTITTDDESECRVTDTTV